MIHFLHWGKIVGHSWIVLVLSLMLPVPPTAQASIPQALLVEAGVLFQRAEAIQGSEQRALLSETFELLLRIVTEYPESAIAVQLSGGGVALMGGPPLSLNVLASRFEENCKKTPTFDCVIEMALMLARSTLDDQKNRLASIAQMLWLSGRNHDSLKVFGLMTDGQPQAVMELLWQEYDRRQFAKAKDLWAVVNGLNEEERVFEAVTMQQALLRIEAAQKIKAGNLSDVFDTIEKIEAPHHRDLLLRDLSLAFAKAGIQRKARVAARSISNRSSEEKVFEEIGSILANSGHWDEARATALSIVDPFRFGQALLAIASAQADSGFRDQTQRRLEEVKGILVEANLDRDRLFRRYVLFQAEQGLLHEAEVAESILAYAEKLAGDVAIAFLSDLAVDLAGAKMRCTARQIFEAALQKNKELFSEHGSRQMYEVSLQNIMFKQARADMIVDAWETFDGFGSDTIRNQSRLMSLVGFAGSSAERASLMVVQGASDEEVIEGARIIEAALEILIEGDAVATKLGQADAETAVWLLINVAFAESKIGIERFAAYTFPKALGVARQERRPDVRLGYFIDVAGAQLHSGLQNEPRETIKEALEMLSEVRNHKERGVALMRIVRVLRDMEALGSEN